MGSRNLPRILVRGGLNDGSVGPVTRDARDARVVWGACAERITVVPRAAGVASAPPADAAVGDAAALAERAAALEQLGGVSREEQQLLITEASEPGDIIWENLGQCPRAEHYTQRMWCVLYLAAINTGFAIFVATVYQSGSATVTSTAAVRAFGDGRHDVGDHLTRKARVA